jgi:hypothetical protein
MMDVPGQLNILQGHPTPCLLIILPPNRRPISSLTLTSLISSNPPTPHFLPQDPHFNPPLPEQYHPPIATFAGLIESG